MKITKTVTALAFLICVGFSSTHAEPGSVRFSLGTNIWGHTAGVEYQHRLAKKWALGIMYSSGYFHLVKNEAGDFLLPGNVPGDEHRVTLELKQLIDLSVYYTRDQDRKTRYFDEFAVGMTHAFIRFKSEYVEAGTEGTFRGQRDYSQYGLFLSCNVVRFELQSDNKMFLSFGVRSRFTVMDSPQEMDYDNGAGRVQRRKLVSSVGDYLLFTYPEVFAALSVGL